MTKSELRTGMVVTLRNGDKYMVFRGIQTNYTNEDVLVHPDANGWIRLGSYNEDMTQKGNQNDSFDIMEVWEADYPLYFMSSNKEDHYFLIWEREEPKEMTMAEIEAALGYKIKIVERKHYVQT